jgi:hypothetical protein
LGFCRERHDSEQNDKNHLLLDHNPLKSCYDQGDHCNPYAVYDNELDNSSIENSTCKGQVDNGGGEYLTEDELGDQLNNCAGEDTNGQCSTAVSKLQIQLNDLINCHKAPLQLYDKIVNLFNDYISSNNFSNYGKLKTQQSFIKQMEVSHPGVMALRLKIPSFLGADRLH